MPAECLSVKIENMKILGIFGWIFLLAISASAQAGVETPTCYLKEIDQRTMKPFGSVADYNSELDRWNRISRPAVNPLDLFVAYQTFRKEKPVADRMTTDKAMHCYMGCVIALATSTKVTDYLGWLKEHQDLTDCDPATHFEDEDATATSQGARLGARDRKECSNLCTSSEK